MAIMDTSIVKVLNRFENKTPARVTRAAVPDKENIERIKNYNEKVSDDAAERVKTFTEKALRGHGTISDLSSLIPHIITDPSQLGMLKRKINTDDLITGIWEIGVGQPVRYALHVEGYIAAYALTRKEEVIDLFVSNLEDLKAFYDSLDRGYGWALPGNAKRDFMRLALQKIGRRFIPKSEKEAGERWKFVYDFAVGLRPTEDGPGRANFNFSFFLESFRPMISAIAEILGTPVQEIVDELAAVWQAGSILKSRTYAEEELKSKKAQKKLSVTPERLKSLMPEDPREDIMSWFDTGYRKVWHYISEAEEQVKKLENTDWFQNYVRLMYLMNWFDALINSINHHIGSSGKTGSKMVAVIKEYEEECRRILRDDFDQMTPFQQIIDRAKKDPNFSEDEQEAEFFKITMKKRKHDIQRIEALRTALKKLKVDFTTIADGLEDRDKETRAQTAVYEGRASWDAKR